MTNHTNKTVLVIGYAYEDYLRITPAGVEENVASLTSSMNRSTASEAAALPPGQPNAPPHWQHVSDQPTFTWHDHRTHWMAEQPPPVVAADPERPHKVFDWAVPLTVDGEPVVIKGTLDWTGESGSGTFETALLVLAGVGSVALGVLIAYAWKRERRPAARAEHEPVDAK